MFNIQLFNGASFPINYQLSPDGRQVFLGTTSGSSSPPAIFSLPNLQQLNGFYLGQTYHPAIQVNGRTAYLQATSRPNIYDLIPTQADPSRMFGFALLNPTANWNTQDRIENIQFLNFSPGNVNGYSLVGIPVRIGRLTFSPSTCPGNCGECGGVCPDGFQCTGSQCASTSPPLGAHFGIRGREGSQEYIYTYKVIDLGAGQAVVLTATNPQFISANVETNDIVRERYFYIDGFQMAVGGNYPIYIFVNGQKRYLSTPAQRSPTGPTVYSLTSSPVQDTARFVPSQPANWRQFTLTPTNFPGLAYSRPQTLALWSSDPTMAGQPAVTSSGTPMSPTGIFLTAATGNGVDLMETLALNQALTDLRLNQAPMGAPERPQPVLAQLFPVGAPCSVDTDCEGWGPNVGQTACCNGTCKQRVMDWRMRPNESTCPENCRGCPTCPPGTCNGNGQPALLGAAINGNGQVFPLGAAAGAAAAQPAPRPIWQQWWFWVIIGVIILLIIVVIVVALLPRGKPPQPQFSQIPAVPRTAVVAAPAAVPAVVTPTTLPMAIPVR